jgi:hypothetical protein
VGDYRLGGHVLVVTPGRDALAGIRKQYLAQASEFCAAFRTEFANFAGSDLLFDRFPTVLDRAFDQTVAAVAEDVARERIYHWDAASLRRELEARATAFRQDFDGLSERYRAIIAGGKQRDAIRAASADNRSSVIGGGFGVKGAAEGIAIATAANAAIGVVHGAASAVAKAAATKADRQQKEELFKDPKTLAVLTGLLHNIILEGHRLVADIVNRENPEPKYDVVSAEACQRAAALTENVKAGRVPASDMATVLVQALQLDPFRVTPWRLWLEHLGDPDGGVAGATEALGVDGIPDCKDQLLSQSRSALAWSTPEECRASLAILQETARFLGLSIDQESGQIEARAETLDLGRRTFTGSIYATVEAANEARAAVAEDADKARRVAEDLTHRTVDGVVHPTTEEAVAIRAINDKKRATELATSRHLLSTSIFLWLAIMIVPLPAALLTLTPAFRPWQRWVALLWMALVVVLLHAILGTLFFAGAAISGVALVLMMLEIRVRRWFSHV